MKKMAIASAGIFFSVLMSVTTASACGDKLLYLSRIYRHHGLTDNTVAIFARPGSLLENIAAPNLDKTFHENGYHLLVVNSHRDLTLALQSGAPDIIIADIADATSIDQPSSMGKIPIIPVIKKDDSSNSSDAKHYLAVIKSPVKPDKFLDALDRAFDSKEMHQNRSKQVSSVSR